MSASRSKHIDTIAAFTGVAVLQPAIVASPSGALVSTGIVSPDPGRRRFRGIRSTLLVIDPKVTRRRRVGAGLSSKAIKMVNCPKNAGTMLAQCAHVASLIQRFKPRRPHQRDGRMQSFLDHTEGKSPSAKNGQAPRPWEDGDQRLEHRCDFAAMKCLQTALHFFARTLFIFGCPQKKKKRPGHEPLDTAALSGSEPETSLPTAENCPT